MRLPLALVTLTLVVTGCGTENDPNLAAAAAKTEDAGSSRFAVSSIESGGSDRVEVTCRGAADYRAERVEVGCEYGPDATMELVAVRNDTWVRGSVFGFGGAGDKWVKVTDDESLGSELSPKRILAMLRRATRSTERVGEEQVRGVDTVRFRLEVDCDEVDLAECAGSTVTVDVWVGDDGLVRRIAVEEGPSPSTFEFYDFGVEVDIEPPPSSDVEIIDRLFGSGPCSSDFGAPNRLAQTTDALRRHGFAISAEPVCSTGSASLENDSATRTQDGHLYCVVRSEAPAGAPNRVQSLGEGVARTALRLENVECTLVADGAASEAALTRLRAALRELER